MDGLKGQTFRFADVEIDTGRGCLRRGADEFHLRQKSFQVLVYLLERRDRLVTKNELIETIWSNVAVTDDVLVQSVKEIRRALGDDPQHPRFIKTIPKTGYRFIGTVSESLPATVGLSQINTFVQTEEITRVEVTYEEGDFSQNSLVHQIPVAVLPKPKSRLPVFVLLTLILIGGGFSIFYFSELSRSAQPISEIVLPEAPGKKSLIVMYFENQSRSAELEWLREGLADMLITNLSRSPKLNILSRQQLYTLLERNGHAADEKISPENALEIARKSRAEMFVVGSFAALGEKIRLDVKLYDSQTGNLQAVETLTVEKPEMLLTEIDLLSLKLANRLNAMPFEQEKPANISSAMTDNLEAYRYYSLAVNEAQALHNKEALALLEKAVSLDAQFAMAHARIGYIYAVTWGFPEKAKPYLEKAFMQSDRLSEKDRLHISAWYSIANLDYPNAIEFYRQIISRYPTETESYLRLGNLLSGEEKNEEAINVLKQGLAFDADAPLLYNALGNLYSMLGKHDEALAMHRRYVALAPSEANAHDSLGMSYQWAGFYAEAIDEYRRALELKPAFDIAVVHLANAHFHTGRYREAIDLYKKYIAVAPSENERARGYSAIAHVYRRMKNYEAAARAANQAIKEKNSAVNELWLNFLEQGDKIAAGKLGKEVFAEPASTNRGRRVLLRYKYYFRGIFALENNQPNEALENFMEAVRRPPPTYETDALEDCLARAYFRLQKFDEAAAEYERILRLNPNYPLARFHLAQIYERQGQIDKAAESYQKFLQIWNTADADIPEIIAARKFIAESQKPFKN